MKVLRRKDLAIEFIEHMDDDDVVSLYNEHAETHNYERIYPNDDYQVNELISTDGMTATEIWDKFASDYSSSDKWCAFSDSTGCLESFSDPDYFICRSEMAETLYESEFADEFFDFVVEEIKEEDAEFGQWVEENVWSSDDWVDTEDLEERKAELEDEEDDEDE